ncbi:HET-domain-containing protein [Cadophora sp. DSE1049]|nr:HET-domain-containing protein [Cadophora sp. DSE1049]
MAPYTYTRLKHEDEEIRLIRLIPGQWEDDISFSILHTPLIPPKQETNSKRLSLEELQKTLPGDLVVRETLDGRYLFVSPGVNDTPNSWDHPDPGFDRALYELQPEQAFSEYEPKYEALSYAWGDTTKLVRVNVLAESPLTLGIGENLAAALRYLRRSERPRTVWVDAICINQDDILERNHEINRMGSIYSLARRTIVWLGEEADHSTHALSTLEHFANQVEFLTGGRTGAAPGADEIKWWRQDSQLPYGENTWSSLAALFRRPWFSRVWVLQEALLGSQLSIVQCGKTSLLWNAIRKAILVLGRKTTIPLDIRSLLVSYRSGLLPHPMRGLPELLRWAKHRYCIDSRDKIYGMLGLVSPSIASRIRLDYSMPTSHVYLSALLSYISVTKQLDLLQQCRLDQRLDHGPSWVPNWSFEDEGNMIGIELGRRPSGYSRAQAQYLPPDVLEVTGVHCASVSLVGTQASGNAKEIFEAIRRWEPEGLQTNDYIGGGSLLDAFLETIHQGEIQERYPTSTIPSLENIRSGYLDAISKDVLNEEMPKTAVHGYMYFETVIFITTREGFLGVTTQGVKENDSICVFLGGDLPMLLRPTGSGEFLVVGSCFVQGLMDGEAFLGPIPSPWKAEVWRRPDADFSTYFVDPAWPNAKTTNDPRLPPLPPEWEEIKNNNSNHPWLITQCFFKNISTGEIMDSDPRMLPEALEQRGVELKRFRLV